MSDLRDQLARQIREALGEANDPDLPIVIIVRELASRISALENPPRRAISKQVVSIVIQGAKWSDAPLKTSWGHGMMVANIAITNDETLTLYAHKNGLRAEGYLGGGE